jgi:hypothetical protein
MFQNDCFGIICLLLLVFCLCGNNGCGCNNANNTFR